MGSTFVQNSDNSYNSDLVLTYDIDLPEDKIIQSPPKIKKIFLNGKNIPSEDGNSEIIIDDLPTGKIIVEDVDNKNIFEKLYLVVEYSLTNSTNKNNLQERFLVSEWPALYNLSLHDITYNSVLATFHITNILINKKPNIEFYQGNYESSLLGSIMIESPDSGKTEDKYVYKIVGLNEKNKI